MVRTRARNVTIGRRGDQLLLGDVAPCGTRFCPNCGPRIQAQRRVEIGETVEAAREQGLSVFFLTLTLAHSADDELSDLLDALDVAWRGLTGGGFWRRLKRRHGLKHFIRVTEEQQGGEHGWHPHFHVLLMLDQADARAFDRFALADALYAEWARLIDAQGYRASRQAQLLVEPTADHLDRMAAYFSKQLTGALAWEMTGGLVKQSRGSSRNPGELLAAAVAGDADARAAWVELELATKGRRSITYSVRARQELKLAPAETNREAAEEQRPAPAESLVTIGSEHWEEHAQRAGFREELAARVAATEDPSELLWWLHDRGIPAQVAPARQERVFLPPEPPPEGAPAWLVAP